MRSTCHWWEHVGQPLHGMWFVGSVCSHCYEPFPFPLFFTAPRWSNYAILFSVLRVLRQVDLLDRAPKGWESSPSLALFFSYRRSCGARKSLSALSFIGLGEGWCKQRETALSNLFNVILDSVVSPLRNCSFPTGLQNSNKSIFIRRWLSNLCFYGGRRAGISYQNLTDTPSLPPLLYTWLLEQNSNSYKAWRIGPAHFPSFQLSPGLSWSSHTSYSTSLTQTSSPTPVFW